MVINYVTGFIRISESHLDNEWFLLYHCHLRLRADYVMTH